MKFLISLIFASAVLLARPEIKSLQVYSGSQTQLPIGRKITIEFDVKNDFTPELKLVFYFCDSGWNPYERYELENPGYNRDEGLDYTRLPHTIENADYHFARTYPTKRVNFPFSGKWIVLITDMFENEVYAQGWFIVPVDSIGLQVKIEKDQTDYLSSMNNLNKTLRISADTYLDEDMDPFRISHIEIIENHKLDYPVVIERGQNDRTRYFEWDANRKMKFVARDIMPGNEYRRLDIRDKGRFAYPDTKAQYDGIETSRFFKRGRKDFNGGEMIASPSDEYSDYLNVRFDFRPQDRPDGDIYLVGAFNDWYVSPYYKMKDENGLYSTVVSIKRGQYDYQYVTGDEKNGYVENIDWLIYEGNFFETTNTYTVLLYYNSPEKGGYDQIIAHKIIQFGGL